MYMYSEIRKAIEGYKNRQSYAFCLHLCFMTQFETSKSLKQVKGQVLYTTIADQN